MIVMAGSQIETFISVVVPVGPGEATWKGLLPLLRTLPQHCEIIVSATTPYDESAESLLSNDNINISWLNGKAGRAGQMNRAARHATGKYLWFLHSDSRFDEYAIRLLMATLSEETPALFYFRLEFEPIKDGPTFLNAQGANLRSRILKMPFGDQGLCLPRETFFALGGYSETAQYGEDHLLVWAARHAGLPIREIPAVIRTSARKYEKNGWVSTTARHVWLTTKQATPEFLRLFENQARRIFWK